ncbi:hypothetical protein [Hyalangium gracile]|uniref:hypothetical protein n=1 Tax=Hyalangium gracile TaxID=394092 RepID=UPI001CCF3256|nr:hypothetical protein [Hyalangium gracile]
MSFTPGAVPAGVWDVYRCRMKEQAPQARGTTVRAALEAALAAAPEQGLTARELSGAVGISESSAEGPRKQSGRAPGGTLPLMNASAKRQEG